MAIKSTIDAKHLKEDPDKLAEWKGKWNIAPSSRQM
jgi:hypothetical protein